MVFSFETNPTYAFLHAINMAQSDEPFEGWSDFTNAIWEESPEIFYFLAGSGEYSLYGHGISETAAKAAKKLEELKEDARFKRLESEVSEYRNFVAKQWHENEKRVLGFFESV